MASLMAEAVKCLKVLNFSGVNMQFQTYVRLAKI